MTDDDLASLKNLLLELYIKFPKWPDLKKNLGPISDILGYTLSPKQAYDIIFDQPDAAPCGKIKKFSSFGQGYYFCGNKCPCAKASRKEKSTLTNIERYGVESVLSNVDVRKKIEKTNIERYGVSNVFRDKRYQEKIRNTNIERYGVPHVMQNSTVKQKSLNSMVQRYGVLYPIQNREISDTIHNTNISRYGNDYAKIRSSAARETLLDKYNHEHALQHPAFLQKMYDTNLTKYGVENFSQKHLSAETLRILKDRDLIQQSFEGESVDSISNKLGIHPTTFSNYWNGHGLPSLVRSSSYEDEIAHFLTNIDIEFETNNKSILQGHHLDFYIPSHNLAIEFNGMYWHSTTVRPDRLYHRNKYEGCRDANIRLLMINEDEWIERKDAIKSRITNILGKSERGIGARKLSIEQVHNKIANQFFNKYHIQGRTGSIIYAVGAWDGGRLVGVMAFNHQRNTQAIELVRYATDGNTYAGLFSRLLKRAIADQRYTDILSFADLRYSLGDVYEKNGFSLIEEIPPDYRYIYQKTSWHKSSFTKKKINQKFGLDMTTLTERQAMEQLKIPRIYDCGKLKYRMII